MSCLSGTCVDNLDMSNTPQMNDYLPPSNTARLVHLIETTIETRGSGKDDSDPIRCITQYWTLQGQLVCEIDPCKQIPAPHTGDWK